MQCTLMPSGIFLSGMQCPMRGSISSPLITRSPAFKPSGARMYDLTLSSYSRSAIRQVRFGSYSIAITVAPGPDNLQVLARGISQGRAAGLVAALGFAAGITFHTTLAALGVAALLRSSPFAFEAIKLAGAAYLVWIGIKALRSQGLSTAHERAPQ